MCVVIQRIIRDKPNKLKVPDKINDAWSMDFMSDKLSDGRGIRTFRVVRALDQIIEWRGKPKAIRCDNGPEYISSKLNTWAKNNGIELLFIQPGNPQQNAYIERYNRTVRHEYLEINELTYEVEECCLILTVY